MNITYLREFIEVGLNLNLSKAAQTLHVSQPSLSKHIAALEKECGVPLLKRGASRIQLTHAGQILFEESFKLVRLHDEALDRIKNLHETEVIRIGGLYDNSICLSLINKSLAAINGTRPVATVNYQDFRHSPLMEVLLSGKIDVAIAIVNDPATLDPSLDATPLFDDPMICLVKDGHAFASRDRVHIAELENQSILQPVGSYSTEYGRSTVRDIFTRHGINPIQRPVFIHSISELATVDNGNTNMLIMERSMYTTQSFSREYHVVGFYEPDVSFSFYALRRKANQSPVVAQFTKQLGKEALAVQERVRKSFALLDGAADADAAGDAAAGGSDADDGKAASIGAAGSIGGIDA